MAEVKPTTSEALPPSEARSGTGFELRLERGGAYVRLADRPIAPGLGLDVLSIEVPGVRFPFNAGAGAVQFRHVLSDLVRLEVVATEEWVSNALRGLDLSTLGLDSLSFAFRDGFCELSGRISGGAPFTLHAGLLPEGEQGLSVVFHSPRLYGPSPVPAALLPHLAAKTFAPIARVPGGVADPVSRLLRRLTAPRGWKVPRASSVPLALLRITPDGARVAWDREPAQPIEPPQQPDLLAAIEGSRAFAAPEGHLARGDLAAARDAYLAAGAEAHAHPFAAERLLSLLVLEERFHDEALDLAHDWLGRRPDFAPALCAEAWVRIARGEAARAARVLATLAATARPRGEAGSVLAAAEGCFRLRGAEPEDVRRAVDAALAVRRDHLPALRALRDLSQATGDREGLLRANRRLVAYAPSDADKARAHAELGAQLLETDPPAARLHLDQALRLAPDDDDALRALARACAAAGEHLRAVRAIERLRERALARGDRTEAGRCALEAGILWEERLGNDENAYLRYGEAAEELPASAELHARAARAAERLGRWADANDHHAAVLPLADASTAAGRALVARTRLALAEVAERRLSDPTAAAVHLEAAVAAEPGDPAVLRRLVAIYRQLSRPADLLPALDRLAPLTEPAAERAALLAEAGAIASSLGRAEAARDRFSAAAALDATCRPALEGMARAAAEAGDALAEREALARLVPLASGADEEGILQERIAGAAERAGDLAGAVRAIAAARRLADTAARLDVALQLARRAGEAGEIARLLAERAQRYRADGDAAAAARAWLERARLLADTQPDQAMAAAAEAHALAPGEPAVLRAQADLAERLGDARAALGSLRALLASGPADAGLLEVRAGRAALAASEPSAAREHAERAMAADAPGALDLLSAVFDRTGDDAGRAGLLERMGRFLEAADLWERTQDSARALQALERAARLANAPPDAIARLAEARLASGDARGAAEALRRLAPLRGGREGGLVALRAFSLDGDPVALDGALACDPSLAPARAQRALLRAELDPEGALADCEAALAGSGIPEERRVALHRLAARLAGLTGAEPRALQHLASYCDSVPADDEALTALAALQRRAGDPGLAATLERRLAVVDAGGAPALRVELAALLGGQAGREDEAIALLRHALDAHEAEHAALTALLRPPLDRRLPPAERLELLGRLAAHAETPSTEAAAAHRERAFRLAEAGALVPALEAARAAARLAPEPDDALELRAMLAEKAGHRAEAAGALLMRARRLVDAEDPDAGTRLAEAGLAALAAGLDDPGQAALRAALVLGVDRELEGPALAALAAGARARGDAAGELTALERLVLLLPTGQRPAARLRQAALLRAAARLDEARVAAADGRSLAPRDPSAVELCRALALEAGDLAEVVERLAELAELDPPRASGLQLERARLLVQLHRPEEADAAFDVALGALPPDFALAREQARLRRGSPSLAARLPSDPLERFAARTADRSAAAEALREAAALALVAGDGATALRCARKAWARTRDEAAFAGPLLARILYLRGSLSEALVLHRALHEAGYPGIDEAEVLTLCRQLAELAASAGETDLALAALSRVLEARPQDHDAALQRFSLDPDRARAVRALAAAAGSFRSDAQRVGVLLRAASSALQELGDRELAERWYRAARADAHRTPSLAAAVDRTRVDSVRAADLGPSALLEALHDAATTALAAGDRTAARDLLEEAAGDERLRGMKRECARDQLALAELDAADGMTASAAVRALTAGELLEEAGDLPLALQALRRAFREDPASDEIASRLERVARTLGEEAAPVLAEVLAARAELAPSGPARAASLARLAESLLDSDLARAAELLEAARDQDPGAEETERRLEEAWRRLDRTSDVATILLSRAARTDDASLRAGLTREAAGLLSASTAEGDRLRAADAWADVFAADPNDLGAARAAADLLLALGRRELALPLLAALVRADPDDEPSARELAEAFAGRHRERAELFLGRAERAIGEPRAQRLREAARALFAAGEDRRGRQVLRDAFDAWPADDDAFFAAIRDAAADIDRLDRVLAARAQAVPGDAPGCHRARADALLAFGRAEQALAAWEACAAASPGDDEVLASWADCVAHVHGDAAAAELDARLVALATQDEGRLPGALEGPSRYRLGLVAWSEGRGAEAMRHLDRAVAVSPDDARAGAALAALAKARAAAGDEAGALSAARRRADRAQGSERQAAFEAGAELVDLLAAGGPDAAALLEGLATLRAEEGAPADLLAPLARRAADALLTAGAPERADALLARAGLAAPAPPPRPLALAPAADAEALEATLELGPGAEGWEGAAAALAGHYRARGALREVARIEARRADAAAEPAERCRAWIRSAQALDEAGGAREEVDAALDIAAEADPDSAEPWLALAQIEQRHGDLVAAARAHLSVSIRAEGQSAAAAALQAARLFEQLDRHEDAARAYRAAVVAMPGCVPARRVLAEEALATGDVQAAAEHLLAIPLAEVAPEARAEHRRSVARTLEAAGRAEEAAGRWLALFHDATGDAEGFEHAGRLTLASDGLDAWLALAAEHEAALAARGDVQRRRDLRHQRGALFAGAGRLEAARGAFLAALELDPGHSASLEAMAALDDRRDEWRRAADDLAADAAGALDGAEAAATLVRRARILHERLSDDAGALAAVDEALVRARLSDGAAAERSAVEAEELLAMLGPDRAAGAAHPDEPPPAPAADPVALVLRAQSQDASGSERAALLERLAGHLERSGDTGAAADALLDAVETDPDRELTWSWLLALIEGDGARLERAAAIRTVAGLEPMEASPEVKAVPPLSISEPETEPARPAEARPSPALDLPELDMEETAPAPGKSLAPGPERGAQPEPFEPPPTDWEPSFFFEAEPPPEEPGDSIRFEPGPIAGGPGDAVRFEPLSSLGIELKDDPFAPPMPGFADDSEPEPSVEFDSEPSVVEPPAPPPEFGEETGPIRFGDTPMDETGPIRFGDTATDSAQAPEEETGPIRLDDAMLGGGPKVAAPAGPAADRIDAARQALVARWDAPPREQCELRRELGLALAAANDLDGAIGALLGANAADPGDGETLAALGRLYEETGKPLEAIAWEERAADLLEAGPERAVRLAELARKAEHLGDRDRAVWLWERVRAADHRYRSALEALCRLYAEAGDRVQLRLVAAELSDVAGDGALEQWAAPLGRSWMDAGKPEVAYAWLQRALRADPTDLTIARDLSRIAERIGSWGEYVRLGEVCADAFAAYDPLAASARFRHFAEVLRDRLSDTERAAVMLEKALSLTPDDADGRRDLLGLWSARPETAQRALDGWLDTVRLDPSDGLALVSLAETCRAVARDLSPGDDALLLERARIASSIAAFVNPALATAPALKVASAIPDELRERVAVPGATGALAHLLTLLSPYLEPLFPADLARRGATPSDRLQAPRAPELRAALEAAGRALSARPHAVFLASRTGAELSIENTQPPSIVAGAETAGLAEASLAFLAARTFDLLDRGWALAGKFAPKDVAILLELACRHVGAEIATTGLPAQRAEAFLAALTRAVPPSVQERALKLASAAGEEFAALEPRRFTAALRRTANRVALLYTGDPGAALRALAAAERRPGQAEVDSVEALSLPDLRDLALFALSDPFVELRVAVIS